MRAPKWVYPTLVLYQSPSQYSLGVLANTTSESLPSPAAPGALPSAAADQARRILRAQGNHFSAWDGQARQATAPIWRARRDPCPLPRRTHTAPRGGHAYDQARQPSLRGQQAIGRVDVEKLERDLRQPHSLSHLLLGINLAFHRRGEL